MTARTELPAEVQRIVDDLSRGLSTLHKHPQTAITAAFDHGVIEVAGNHLDTHTFAWRTVYGLRGQSGVA